MNRCFHAALLVGLLLALFGLGWAPCASWGEEAVPRGRLFFLGVAVDTSPPNGKTLTHYDYAPDNFTRLLTAQAKPLFGDIRVATLKGEEVKGKNIFARLHAIRDEARKEDLVFVYWGTHGSTDAGGWSASIAGGEALLGSDLKRELAKLPCSVVIAVSTCGSGGFVRSIQETTPRAAALPENVTAICACNTSQSTNNELDVALLEALIGFGDLDRNGEVTLGEALEYVPKRYHDWFAPGGRSRRDILPVLGETKSSPLDRPLTKVSGERALVVHQGRWYGVQILERLAKGRLKVQFLGFDTTCADGTFSMPDVEVVAESVFLPGEGMPLEVEWRGTWYPARLLERTEQGARIHYVGYPTTDDETVPRERVRVPYAGVAPFVARGRASNE